MTTTSHRTEVDVAYLYAALHAARRGLALSREVEEQASNSQLRTAARAFRITQRDDFEQALGILHAWNLPDLGEPSRTTPSPPLRAAGVEDHHLMEVLIGHTNACILLAREEMIVGCGMHARNLAELRISSAFRTLRALQDGGDLVPGRMSQRSERPEASLVTPAAHWPSRGGLRR